jgi:hypothetical protein
MNNGWIVVIEPSTNAIVVSSSYSMVREINHLANCLYEAVTEVYFFLKRSTILKPSHKMPKHTKKKGTMPAANASIAILSITFGQLQFYPIVKVIVHTLQAVFKGIFAWGHVIVHAQGVFNVNLIHNRTDNHLAALQ